MQLLIKNVFYWHGDSVVDNGHIAVLNCCEIINRGNGFNLVISKLYPSAAHISRYTKCDTGIAQASTQKVWTKVTRRESFNLKLTQLYFFFVS